jgi:DNA-binding NtrC family response regulator
MEGYRAKILVVDDEESNLLAMEKILRQEAYQVVTAKQAASALNLFRRQAYDLVLTDLRMPGVSGLELLRTIRKENSTVPVVILTAYGTVADAVEAMKLGAVDFLAKPLRREVVLKCVQDSLSKRVSEADTSAKVHFVGASGVVAQIKKTVRMLARTSASVLVEGESGTGKEVVAKTIHQESGRAGRMISVNCGAIPESLLESELFGYEKGAFTGAIAAKPGIFEAADKGTLFLDEIADMPMSLQVKLLRLLQDGIFFRLGSTEARHADVRVVAATNGDLKKRIADGRFREDLYYRLNVISIQVPSLRERSEDIPILAEHFLEAAKTTYGRADVGFHPDALLAMSAHDWPGNIRELKNLIERTLVMVDGSVIGPEELGLGRPQFAAQPSLHAMEMKFSVGTSLRDMELEAIRRTLAFTGGDKAKAAELLGINQRTIYRKLQELQDPENG